jgi:hypothetical protein
MIFLIDALMKKAKIRPKLDDGSLLFFYLLQSLFLSFCYFQHTFVFHF